MSSRFARRFRVGQTAPPGPHASIWVFAFRRRELLVPIDRPPAPIADLEALGLAQIRSQYVGLLDEVPVFSVELADGVEAPPGMTFRDLRSLYGRLEDALHEAASRAVQLVEWDRTHQFCGACGTATLALEQERARSCPACGLSQFPRLSPAVIVSVERDDEILLGRSPHFPPGIYSVLAGFVEPGESAEDAVRREVEEESGILVDRIRYFASQAWPFPHSLMLGFTARFEAGEIRLGDELEDAAFFCFDELPRTFPGNVSISQWLIGDFVRRMREGR
ncbi:NAD+ diphosphatase [Myxococcaceae bacterium]|nr:NAD+ diphosphatase [Myxococcaceae bacterium]